MNKISQIFLLRISIVLILGVYFYFSMQFSTLSMREGYGPGIFPKIISFFLLLFLIKDFFSPMEKNIGKNDSATLAIFLIAVFIPLYFIDQLGMHLTLAVFLIYLNHALKIPILKNILLTSVSIIVIHFLFVEIFHLSFPRINIY